MSVLSPDLRGVLQRRIIAARDAAEDASTTALKSLGVDVERVPEHLGDVERRVRVALRAESRQLGSFGRLVEECAYEQWHRMLFARFLAENGLLIHPDHRVAVSLAECEQIARERGEGDPWLVAAEFASVMLPGIFRSEDPVLQVRLAPEGQRTLEDLLAGLPQLVFTSDDGLGWVYQYWQTKRKKQVDDSGRKIGAADIAPVTQLFTEHYMVRFLLENTLGAWWASARPASPLVKEWDYLRFDDNGKPAAGSFGGWPKTVADVTVLDPCCGSGHFLVTAFEMLRRMRMEAEGLDAAHAGDAVLRENLFGLELDARCTQIAAFALALAAWKSGGYRQLPIPSVACSGISAAGRLEDWKRLGRGDTKLEASLERLHALLGDAADLGSLIDPLRETDGDLLAAQFSDVAPLLDRALAHGTADDPASAIFGKAAAGAAQAAALLARRYTLVVTNPPFLARGKQADLLKSFCERSYPRSKADLATCFIERCVRFSAHAGTAGLVAPQNWLFLGSYEKLRRHLLTTASWNVVVKLGPAAFAEMNWWAATTSLASISNDEPTDEHVFVEVDAQDGKWPPHKGARVRNAPLLRANQLSQLKNPDARIAAGFEAALAPLGKVAGSFAGIQTGDYSRFGRCFWELPAIKDGWEPQQSTVEETGPYSGREHLFLWEDGNGALASSPQARIQGLEALNKEGVVVSQMRHLPVTLYSGSYFDNNCAAIVPHADPTLVAAIYAYCASDDFRREVRQIDPKVSVTNATLAKVPFDAEHWRQIASEAFPNGASEPVSTDPTQWLFAGHPYESDAPLQVALGRLLGYRWPRQTGSEFPKCPVVEPDGLEELADEDGIVCLPSVKGERPAAERLRALLAVAYGEDWSPGREADLLARDGYAEKSLEQWLRDGFFEQHYQLFHQRPFVWQIWDGRKDGFSVLVNYHRLDRALLGRLAYTYVGDWIRQQRSAVESGATGSELRLAAAVELQRKLQLILDGEPPYDIFIRWKSIEEQPLGWEPDINDGVRINIRPFVTAGVLRKNPRINWKKDRGKDIEGAPWYHLFESTDRQGERINDHHLTLAEKRAAQDAAA